MNEPDHLIASRHWERAWACDCGPCTRHRLVQTEERRDALASLQALVRNPFVTRAGAQALVRSARLACLCSRPDIQPDC